MEMNIESIRKYVDEAVKPVDFLKLLSEAGPEDEPEAIDDEPAGGSDEKDDLGGDDDFGGDLGGGDDFGGGDFGGAPSGPGGHEGSGDSGEDLGDDTESTGDKFADREDDPDFVGVQNADGSAAESNPSGQVIYDIEGVLKGINNTISAGEVNISEIDKAKNVLEVVANGKKLIASDFDGIQDYESFSDIINRSLFQTDEKTQNYFKMKIKAAILAVQNDKKIDASKNAGEVDNMRNLASKF